MYFEALCSWHSNLTFFQYSRGVKEVIKKRLKNHFKRVNLIKARLRSNRDSDACYDYLAVIDFEATCDENNAHYNHEIIEFPIVIIDTRNIKIVGIRSKGGISML
jgi:3'-5' exoribonuclease 1